MNERVAKRNEEDLDSRGLRSRGLEISIERTIGSEEIRGHESERQILSGVEVLRGFRSSLI
ncbi:hypothetical protein BDW75DRAFT_172817 [Aspergillus navahoensis]